MCKYTHGNLDLGQGNMFRYQYSYQDTTQFLLFCETLGLSNYEAAVKAAPRSRGRKGYIFSGVYGVAPACGHAAILSDYYNVGCLFSGFHLVSAHKHCSGKAWCGASSGGSAS